MTAPRKLSLRKAALVDLTPAEASQVAGGISTPSCLTRGGGCNSDFQQCITGVGCVPTLYDCVLLTEHACG